jgi:ABC-type sugar transport system substrate-binding protein
MYRVGFNMLQRHSEFAGLINRSLAEAVQRVDDVELVTMANCTCESRACDKAQQFIEQEIDLAVVYHRNPKVVAEIRSRIFPIPVISVDVQVPLVTYFGVDNRQCGLMTADVLLEWIENNWDGSIERIVAVTDFLAAGVMDNRMDHIIKPLQLALQNQDVPLERLPCPTSRESAQEVLTAHFARYGADERIAVIAFDADMTHAILDIIDQRDQNIIVLSLGSDSELERKLLSGDYPLVAATTCDPNAYGESLLQLIRQKLSGEIVPRNNYVDVQLLRTPF